MKKLYIKFSVQSEHLDCQQYQTVLTLKLSIIIIQMTNQFSNDQIKQIQEAFKLFDKDNDGHLTREVSHSSTRKLAHSFVKWHAYLPNNK